MQTVAEATVLTEAQVIDTELRKVPGDVDEIDAGTGDILRATEDGQGFDKEDKFETAELNGISLRTEAR